MVKTLEPDFQGQILGMIFFFYFYVWVAFCCAEFFNFYEVKSTLLFPYDISVSCSA